MPNINAVHVTEEQRTLFERAVYHKRFIAGIPTKDFLSLAELCKRDPKDSDDYADEHVSAMWFGYKIALRDAEYRVRFDKLRKLCGYVENASDRAVVISQDDATHDWTVSFYKPAQGDTFWFGRSLEQAIDSIPSADLE